MSDSVLDTLLIKYKFIFIATGEVPSFPTRGGLIRLVTDSVQHNPTYGLST